MELAEMGGRERRVAGERRRRLEKPSLRRPELTEGLKSIIGLSGRERVLGEGLERRDVEIADELLAKRKEEGPWNAAFDEVQESNQWADAARHAGNVRLLVDWERGRELAEATALRKQSAFRQMMSAREFGLKMRAVGRAKEVVRANRAIESRISLKGLRFGVLPGKRLLLRPKEVKFLSSLSELRRKVLAGKLRS